MASVNRYHINPETGRPGQCTATKRGCKYGIPEGHHYPTKEATKAGYEGTMASKTITILNKKSKKDTPPPKIENPLPKDLQRGCSHLTAEQTALVEGVLRRTLNLNNQEERALQEKFTGGRHLFNLPLHTEDVRRPIPQNPNEVNSTLFRKRSIPLKEAKFKGVEDGYLTRGKVGRAADGIYFVGGSEDGYIVYSPSGRIIGEASTLKEAEAYLQFEQVGTNRVVRLEDEEGNGPFNSEVFGPSVYETQHWTGYGTQPKHAGITPRFLKKFQQHHGESATIFGCAHEGDLRTWFPKDDFENGLGQHFSLVEYEVPASAVVAMNGQVVALVEKMKRVKETPFNKWS